MSTYSAIGFDGAAAERVAMSLARQAQAAKRRGEVEAGSAYNALCKAARWLKENRLVVLRDGVVQIPSRSGGVAYATSEDACSCPAYTLPREAGDAPRMCWHRAVVMVLEAMQLRESPVVARIAFHEDEAVLIVNGNLVDAFDWLPTLDEAVLGWAYGLEPAAAVQVAALAAA